jgi:hypothetical protein
MRRARRVGVVLLLAIVVVSGLSVAPAGASDHRSSAPGVEQLGDAGIEPDGVVMRADLRTDGAARWTIEYRVRLNDENTTAAFESLRDDIGTNETAHTATFADRMRATARTAQNTTGREMGISNVSVRATRRNLPQEYGVVTYHFEWAGFARSEGDTLEAGDALAGLFLDRQTTFVVAWPDGYATTNVQPSPDERRDNAVVWIGPTDFDDGQPTLSLSAAAAETDSGEGSDDGESGGGTGDGAGDGSGDSGGGSMLPLVGGAAILVASALAVGWWWRSQSDDAGATTASAADDSSPSKTVGQTDRGAGVGADADGEQPGEDGSGDAGDGDAQDEEERTDDEAADDQEADDEATDDESAPWEGDLLSNEERVLALLEHNDGRMKQQAVASELDWSDAKTSQVVGKLRDAEEVETFRLGRENVVSLPGSGLS